MNIILFSDTYEPELNGVATSVSTLSRILKENGHNVYVVTTNPFSKKVTFKNNVIRVPGIRLKSLYNYILASITNKKVMKILKGIDADIIHVNTDFSIAQIAYIYKKHSKAALVYTYHTMYEDYTYYITKGFMDRSAKWIIREYSLATCEKSNAVISPSYKTLNYLRKIGVSKYIGVIPTGIDTSRFLNYQCDENRKKEFFEKFNIPSDAKVLLSLGRVAKEKGIDELLEHFSDLCKIRNDAYFVIVGNGPDIDHFKNRAIELGVADKTKFIGAVPYSDIDFYYSIGHVFVNASVSETQGLTYLEAMASKKIILAKYDSNLTELIVDGQNGFFFEKKEEFLQKICQIFDNYDTYYSVMVKNMIESVDKLSLKNFYTNIMEVYEKAKRNNI